MNPSSFVGSVLQQTGSKGYKFDMDQILEEGVDSGSIDASSGPPVTTITFNAGASPINPKLVSNNSLRHKVNSRGALYNNGAAVLNLQSPGAPTGGLGTS